MSDAGLYRKLLPFLLKIRSVCFIGLQGTLFLPFTPCHELFDKVGGTDGLVQSLQSKGNLRRSFIENCEKFDFQVDQKCIITKNCGSLDSVRSTLLQEPIYPRNDLREQTIKWQLTA